MHSYTTRWDEQLYWISTISILSLQLPSGRGWEEEEEEEEGEEEENVLEVRR